MITEDSLLRYQLNACYPSSFLTLLIGQVVGFDTLSVRFDNFCAPSVHFGIPFGHNPAHLSLEVSAASIVARHLDSLLA